LAENRNPSPINFLGQFEIRSSWQFATGYWQDSTRRKFIQPAINWLENYEAEKGTVL